MTEIIKKDHLLIKKNSELNIGIRILRVFLSFMVIMDHIYNKKELKKYYYILYYHIPTFFLISFYFTHKTFISFNIKKIKLRLERLLIPYFSWCFISWIIKNFYFYVLNKDVRHSFKDFIINLINGHIFNVVLWFQNILILQTIIFIIIIYLFRLNYILVFQILLIISYLLQYSGVNHKFFKKNFSTHSRSTYGRLVETIPHSITGFFLSSIDIMKLIKKKKINVFLVSIIILVIISKYEIFGELKSFKYGGIRLNIAAFCIFIIFSLLPSKIFNINLLNKFIMQITKYTGGIYFTHYLIGKGYLCRSIYYVKKGTFLGCIFIYLISYIVSLIGNKILGKTKFKHLFI